MQIPDATIKRWIDQAETKAKLGIQESHGLESCRILPGKSPGFKTVSLAELLATAKGADLAMRLATQEDLKDTDRSGSSAVMVAAKQERIKLIPPQWLTQENLTSPRPTPVSEENINRPLHYIAVLGQIQHIPDQFLTPGNLGLRDDKGTTVMFFLGKSNTFNYLPVFKENFGIGLPAVERQAWLEILYEFRAMAAGKLIGMGIENGITAALQNLGKDLSHFDKPGTWQID